MKIKFEVEGDFYEETPIIKRMIISTEMYEAIEEARAHIRIRIKESTNKDELRSLYRLQDILYIEET